MNNHHEHPELWFRPSPVVPLAVLSKLIEDGAITATPRLGVRDAAHPKGYAPGQRATLRVCDGKCEAGGEVLARDVRITSVESKRLRELEGVDLQSSLCYSAGWKSLQHDLSFFEGRQVGEDEMVSIIEFEYLPA